MVKAYESLAPGDRLVTCDHIMSENRLRPRSGAIFNVHLLVCTAEGHPYAFSELREGWKRQVSLASVWFEMVNG